MRIAYVAYHSLDLDNAATEHIIAVVSGLARKGHKVSLFVPHNKRGVYGADLVPIRANKGIFFDWYVSKQIREGFDILYLRDFAGAYKTALSAKKRGIPVVVEHNGLIHFEGPRISSNLIRLALVKYEINFAMRRKLNLGDVHLTVTKSIGHFLSNYYNVPLSKFRHIPNGVDIMKFRPKDKHIVREYLGFDISAFWVGYIGAMYPWHILDEVIEGVGIAMKNDERIHFFIGGKGPDLERVRKLVEELPSDRIRTMFPVPIDKSPDYIASLDLGIAMMDPQLAPYCWQVKINNHSACGVPSLATGCDEFAELESAGMIVPTMPDANSIAEKILFFAQNPSKLREMGMSARQFVEKKLSWEEIVIKIENICESTAKGGK